jgi:membrane glycosyltransferase
MLLVTPEEHRPPPIATRANELQARNGTLGFDDVDALLALYDNPDLRQQHEAMLPQMPARKRGDIETDRALAEAKLVEAETVDEALHWLKPKERMVVLHDRALLNLAMNLKRPQADEAKAAAE